MKDVGKAAVAVSLLCFITQIGFLFGARRQNAVSEFYTFHKTRPVLYVGRHQRSATLTQKGHLQDATVVLTAFHKVLTLDLVLNRHLLPANYTEKYFLPDGSTVVNTYKNHTYTNCYYHGEVRNSSDSAVAVSTCKGLSGYIRDGGEVFYIEPAEGVLAGQHYVYRDTDRIRNQTMGVPDDVIAASTLGKTQTKSSRKKRSLHWPYNRDSKTRIVELYIVNDHEQYINNDRDISETIRRTKDIINVVSSLYRAVDIYVALVGVEIWSERNQIEVINQATDTMNNFLDYRRTSICPHHRNDNAQMITGHTFLDGVVGKATIGGICTYQYSGGVDMDHSSLAVVAGTTITHEMGHNFGLQHDGIGCDCPLPRCIMSPSSGGSEKVTWSSCSTEQFADAFHQGFDYCLRNLPDELYGDAYCGNGFMEKGEECDCGLAQDCDTKCCDPTTCKLTTNSTCATGECCDLSTCKLKATTTPCRPAKNACDLPEFCNGKVEFCPSDIFLQNGVPCKNDVSEAYCYEGQCNSHGSQCQLLWGKTGSKAHDLCYTHYNTHGMAYGNCGFNWMKKSFKKCHNNDTMCGMLHCTHRNEKLMFWSGQMSYTLPSNWVMVDGEKERCNGAILDVGLDMSDPGMVPNGAKCGDDKLCVNHECVPVASLHQSVCPDCHGFGVCNSLNECHCEVGYAPPYCDHAGDGGSVHSGPIKIYKASRGLLVGLLVFFLLIVPLLVLAVFCGYRHRSHLKKMWREGATRHYRSVCKNVPRCDRIWKSPPKRTHSTSRGPSMELGHTKSFRREDISHPSNLNSTNRTVEHVTSDGRHVTSEDYSNGRYDNKPVPVRTAPVPPMSNRPAPKTQPVHHVSVVLPQGLAPVVPPPRVVASNDMDHEYVNKPCRPPPPRQKITPQATATHPRAPVPSPRTQPSGNRWQQPHGHDNGEESEAGRQKQFQETRSPFLQQPEHQHELQQQNRNRDNLPVTDIREESEDERRERFRQTRDAFRKPAVPAKPNVSRSESQTSRAGRLRPNNPPPPPPQSSKPSFNN